MDNEFMIFEDQLQNGESGDLVDGIRIMITGEFQKVINEFMKDNIDCTSYTEVIGQLVTAGITEIIESMKK